MIVLVAIHVVAAAFWFGSSVLFSAIVIPTVLQADPISTQKLAPVLFRRTGWVLLSANIITIASGIWLFSIVSGGFNGAFLHSSGGTVLSVGALTGIFAGIAGARAMFSRGAASQFGVASAALTLPALVLMVVSTRV